MSVVDDIIRREGSKYTNHSADRGGPTKYGVTQAALSEWRGRTVTAEEVAALTEREARELYWSAYVQAPHFNLIADQPLQNLMVDSGVLHGRARATKWLQAAVGAKQDGRLGTQTLAALNKQPPGNVYKAVLKARIQSIGAFISSDPKQAVFAAGWSNRVAEFI